MNEVAPRLEDGNEGIFRQERIKSRTVNSVGHKTQCRGCFV